MTKKVLLNNVDHADLKVFAGHSAVFGDAVNQALIFPTEFAEIQREYPIFFCKNERDEFQAVALLGLDRNENLFLDDDGWRARYIPAVQARGPFSIALQRREDEDAPPEPMIHVDLDHPRISHGEEGEALFLPHGGNTPYLERIAHVLRLIHQGIEMSRSMFAAFDEAGLIKPVTIEIKLNETEQFEAPGYYAIDEQRLAVLSGAFLERLNRAGFLQAAFYVLSSLGNVRRLIELKNLKREREWAKRAAGREAGAV